MITSRNLSVLAYANGFTLWHARENSPITTADDIELNKSTKETLRPGDLVIINSPENSKTIIAWVCGDTADTLHLRSV